MESTHRSLILLNGSLPLPVGARHDLALTLTSPSVTLGPGRFLHQTYTVVGKYVETSTNRIAHKLGRGPVAVTGRLKKALGSGTERESKLQRLYDSFTNTKTDSSLRELERDCVRLAKHASPSESPSAQLEAFKSIVSLVTVYPNLRRFLLRYDVFREAAYSEDAIADIMMRDGCDVIWNFQRRFAAFCLSNNEVTAIVEHARPRELGRPSEKAFGIVEELVLYCSENSTFLRLIATRYVGGILEFPSFWAAKQYPLQRYVVEKLCKAAIRLVEDLDVDSTTSGDDDVDKRLLSDVEGIDLFVDGLLAGIQSWIQRNFIAKVMSECWFEHFLDLIEHLRRPAVDDLFPNACCRASIDWRSFLKPFVVENLPNSVLPAEEYEWTYHPVIVDESTVNEQQFQYPVGPDASSINAMRPETLDDESLHHRPSSLLEHINTASVMTISGSPSSDFNGGKEEEMVSPLGTPSDAMSDMSAEETSRPAHARYSFDGTGAGELPMSAGTEVEVLDDRDPAWWYARDARTGREGVVPAAYLY